MLITFSWTFGHLYVFEKISIQVLCPFFIGFVFCCCFVLLFQIFCYWAVWNSSYVFSILTPYQMHDLQLFSPHLLILLVVALTVQNFLVWCSSSCLLCFCCMWFSFHKQKIIPKTHVKRFFPITSTRIFTVSYSHHAKKKKAFWPTLSIYIGLHIYISFQDYR